MEHPKEVSKVSKDQQQVNDVKNIMTENIDEVEKLLSRGEGSPQLVDNTDMLRDLANEFRRQAARQVKREMWLQNMKVMIIVLGTIITLILVIILSICHSFKCT
ncbi:hypothetical protein LUZ60_005192 [Juncus effusus]|nr:hypothetical protein LUZ60_005192 [Juncus effusus]